VQYTILIIDDDETTHEVLGLYLSRAGYRVLRADDGRQGLALLRSERPDLALLDVQMPELDGFQTLEQARREYSISEIPVIFLTSLDRYNLKVKGLELGADDYIVKPFHSGEVLARVKTTLRRCSRYQRINGMVQGDLASIGLAELLQTVELGRKSAVIRLPEIGGTVYLEQGMLARVEQGRFTGAPALLRLFLLERGRFEASFGELPADLEREPESVSALLLESLAYLDEFGFLIGPEADAILETVAELPELIAVEGIAQLPMPLKQYLCLMDGDLKDNAQLLVAAAAAGLVRLSGLDA
jgi:CheY-like chemotaxis protein